MWIGGRMRFAVQTYHRHLGEKGGEAMPLDQEFSYYLNHQDELVKRYKGKHIVIKGDQVLGAYNDALEAIRVTSKDHEVGTFLVQLCDSDPESTVQTFNSRVNFA